MKHKPLNAWSSMVAASSILAALTPVVQSGETWPSLHNGGNTSIQAKNLPAKWSPEKGVAWSTELPGYGQSAPVIWRERVYTTSVEGDNKEWCFVNAYDMSSGKRVWEHKFAATVQTRNSYMVSRAAPTPIVDADGVYALFESGDLHALTHDGKKRWTTALFDTKDRKFINGHGYGASPTATATAIIVIVDHKGPSYLLALAKDTGKPLWQTERKSRSSWTSPQVTRVAGREQIVISSSGTVDGYDADSGKQLWSYTGVNGNRIPSVTVQGDRVYVGAAVSQQESDEDAIVPSNCCLQITPNTAPGYKLLWKSKKALCHYVSPLVHGGRAYFVTQNGVLHCLDADTGKEIYVERTSGPCWAQPIAVDQRIYLFHKDGLTTVVKAGAKYEAESVNRMWKEDAAPLPKRSFDFEPQGPKDTRPRRPAPQYQDPLVYGVAAVDGTFVARLGTHLYCVREQDNK